MKYSDQPPPTREPRGRYRPPIGIPLRGEPRAQATVAAVLLHAFIILLVLVPTAIVTARATDFQPMGAGGKGPVGGGGGGNRGTGGETKKYTPERLRFVRVAPPAPKEKAPVPETPKPPEIKPPEIKKPEPEPVPVAAPKDSGTTVSDSSLVKGTGGGSGNDGTAGSGPGTGGGVGSGTGTGRGSGNGPGTGGGEDIAYPPTVVALPILPLPVPAKVRPYRMVAEFEVDTTGQARLLSFNPSRDAGYNRRIREMLLEIRFRPAVRINGRPVRALAVVTAEAM